MTSSSVSGAGPSSSNEEIDIAPICRVIAGSHTSHSWQISDGRRDDVYNIALAHSLMEEARNI